MTGAIAWSSRRLDRAGGGLSRPTAGAGGGLGRAALGGRGARVGRGPACGLPMQRCGGLGAAGGGGDLAGAGGGFSAGSCGRMVPAATAAARRSRHRMKSRSSSAISLRIDLVSQKLRPRPSMPSTAPPSHRMMAARHSGWVRGCGADMVVRIYNERDLGKGVGWLNCTPVPAKHRGARFPLRPRLRGERAGGKALGAGRRRNIRRRWVGVVEHGGCTRRNRRRPHRWCCTELASTSCARPTRVGDPGYAC